MKCPYCHAELIKQYGRYSCPTLDCPLFVVESGIIEDVLTKNFAIKALEYVATYEVDRPYVPKNKYEVGFNQIQAAAKLALKQINELNESLLEKSW